MTVAFDIISDLYVEDPNSFSWDTKATSPYCIVCGNISSDPAVTSAVLRHLNKWYHGILYIGGTLECGSQPYRVRYRHAELARICKGMQGVAYLYNHVVIIDSVAVVGAVGWNSVVNPTDLVAEIVSDKLRQADYEYLKNTIERLQVHGDVKRIVVATHCVPDSRLWCGEVPLHIDEFAPLTRALVADTEHKVSHWVYGESKMSNNVEMERVTFVNNAWNNRPHYYATRIEC